MTGNKQLFKPGNDAPCYIDTTLCTVGERQITRGCTHDRGEQVKHLQGFLVFTIQCSIYDLCRFCKALFVVSAFNTESSALIELITETSVDFPPRDCTSE